jgi:hypothetical protein
MPYLHQIPHTTEGTFPGTDTFSLGFDKVHSNPPRSNTRAPEKAGASPAHSAVQTAYGAIVRWEKHRKSGTWTKRKHIEINESQISDAFPKQGLIGL